MGFLSKTEIEGEDSSPGKGREPKQKKYLPAKYLLIFCYIFKIAALDKDFIRKLSVFDKKWHMNGNN